jgi:hypothetical protein
LRIRENEPHEGFGRDIPDKGISQSSRIEKSSVLSGTNEKINMS